MKKVKPKKPAPERDGAQKTYLVLISIALLATAGLFLAELYKLGVLTETLFAIVAALIVLVDLLLIWLICFKLKQKWGLVLMSVLMMIGMAGNFGGWYYLNKTKGALNRLTQTEDGTIMNTINVYALKDSSIKDVKDMNQTDIGILKNVNRSGSDKLMADLKTQDITVSEKDYDNFGPLADALYDKEVQTIAVNSVYLDNITGLEKFKDFAKETKVVYSFSYKTTVSNSINSVSSITSEPFTVMLNGSDSRGGLGDTDRSDVNMLATINPKTKVVLLTSIPRDAYVETVCDPEYDCLQGQYDKLTHTGIHTYNTTQKTIENFMDVDINYTFRANFSAVIDIVDALGGIDVNVAPGYAVESFWTNDMFGTNYGVHEGVNHLNGEAALCYARERYAYTEGDFQRIKNQQEVLTAIAKKALSPSVITQYAALLDAIDGNFWTNLSTQEITDLIQDQLKNGGDWSFISYSLEGTPSSEYCAESYSFASVVILDQNTVRFANKLIHAVLDGESATKVEKMISDFKPEAPDYQTPDASVPDTYSPEYDQQYQYVEEPVYYVDPTPYVPPVQNYEPVVPVVPVDPTPVDPTPVDPTPVDPTPVDPTPVDPTPVDPTPVDPTPTEPTTDPAANNPAGTETGGA